MIEDILGSKTREKILLFTEINGEFYPTQIKNIFEIGLISVQKQAEKLENTGVISSVLKGKTRIYSYNLRYPFTKEIKDLMKKVYKFLPKEEKIKYEIRKRPRRPKKPL